MDDARKLDPIEARLLGVLVEKELTTPEQYPLSLNALTAGCNQKSNRDPVLEFSEAEVHAATGKLIVKGWAGAVHPAGSRVERFRHNAAEVLGVGRAQIAILAELLLRGPQQPGELRARAARMVELPTQPALLEALEPLLARGLVARLEREPGARAESYGQTLAPLAHPPRTAAAGASHGAAPHPAALPTPPVAPAPAVTPGELAAVDRRVSELAAEIQLLRRQLSNLAWKLGEKLDPQ
ncbi:MAG: DUF480 domain-containing protein [Planctomycetes bacterium]|nr:DUF480 domain-containing protein [Planctomycetota bacterium]